MVKSSHTLVRHHGTEATPDTSPEKAPASDTSQSTLLIDPPTSVPFAGVIKTWLELPSNHPPGHPAQNCGGERNPVRVPVRPPPPNPGVSPPNGTDRSP